MVQMNIPQSFIMGFGVTVLILVFAVGAHPTNFGAVIITGLVIGAITAYVAYRREENDRIARLAARDRSESENPTNLP